MADKADSHADGRKNTGELGNVKIGGDGRFLAIGSRIGDFREAGHGLFVLLRSTLVNAVVDHAAHLLVRRPEGLAYGNGIVHDGDDLGGVVVAVAVIEHGVLAFAEAVHVAVREHGGNVETLAQFFAGAGAVQDVHAAERGDFRRRSGHLHAQVRAALVNVQTAGLEHGLMGGVVEIGQDHIVVQEAVEMLVQAQDLVHFLDGKGVGFLRFVFLQELQQGGFLVFLEDGLYAIQAQGFHLRALLGVHPGHVRGEGAQDGGPFGLVNGVFLDAYQAHNGVYGCFPGRVHGFEIELAVCTGLCQGLQADLLAGGGQVALDGGNLGYAHVHGLGRCSIETDKLAAHEIVRYLIFNGVDGGQGVCGFVTIREHVLGAGGLPGFEVCAGGVEGFHMIGRNARHAAAVQGRCNAGNGLDELGCGLVRGAGGGDDAVAVELRLCENLHVVGGVLQGDGILVQLQVLQDLPGRCLQAGAVRVIGIEAVQGQAVVFLQEVVGILNDAREPLGGLDDLVHADSSVMVNVDELEGGFVEFQAGGGAAEDRPQFTVQFTQVADVFSALNLDTDRSAYGGELPGIGVVGRFFHTYRFKITFLLPQI